ncbi:MAG: RagB/SusD family nutrient uptake outer membrane protein [Mangrovibacterium sp.]
MKSNFKYYIILIFLAVTLWECDENFLDPNNPTSIGSNDVWNDQNLIEMYLNRLYNDRPGWDEYLYCNIADESRITYTYFPPFKILLGEWDEVSNPMGFWAYQEVRRTNEFLFGLEGSSIDPSLKQRWQGEARFLRAFLYFDMVKRYGGVPIITTPQDIDDDLLVSRNDLDECFEFIVNELDQAIEKLPENAVRGKATKGSAMALKARVLLFYASPLFNENNSLDRWKNAADASMEVINLNKYDLYPDLSNLWLDKGSNHVESIFEVQYKIPEKHHGLDSWGRPLVVANQAAGERCPLQELIDAYPMKNGKLITDPESGYDPQNPYLGRDNRFYEDIGYNGAKFKGTSAGAGSPLKEFTLQIYKGGRDFDETPSFQIYNTYTGYYSFKFMNFENNLYEGNRNCDQSWLEIRYAEVLLNYAEAQNEYLPVPDASIYQVLNKIRQRAGIENDIPIGSLNKSQMRELIRNERYVEFSYEIKRYWDLRRWELATTRLNGKRFTGVLITKNDDETFTYDYNPVDEQPVVFTEKMYWMPIPLSEINKNSNLIQNPGW